MSIDTETRGRILLITLNRPEAMNALDADHAEALERAIVGFQEEPDLWVAIITGTGRAFSAGMDLVRSAPRTLLEAREGAVPRPNLLQRLQVDKPLIAAVNGYCMAAGFGLALLCDVRIASEKAIFRATGAGRGILAGGTQAVRLPRLVGLGRALEMLLWSRNVDAHQAERFGLVSCVVPENELLPTAWRWAEESCQLAPLAVQAAKEVAVRGIDMSLTEAFRLENEVAGRVRRTADAEEGITAFREKRPPRFQGR